MSVLYLKFKQTCFIEKGIHCGTYLHRLVVKKFKSVTLNDFDLLCQGQLATAR